MANRTGGVSIVRLSVFAAIIGVVIIVIAGITYLTDQVSKRSPLDIAPYPESAYWGSSNERPTSRNVFYLTADTPEEVVLYFQQKMTEHYGNNDQRCVRYPASGNAPGSENDANVAPFVFRCMFDNSGFNSSQYTQVEIYPGRADPDPTLSAEGQTVIRYIQQWQR